MPEIPFKMFTVVAPDGWEDVTDSLEIEGPPFTLARADGVGALQFSIATYSGGERPDPSPDDLLEMVEGFGQSRRSVRRGTSSRGRGHSEWRLAASWRMAISCGRGTCRMG